MKWSNRPPSEGGWYWWAEKPANADIPLPVPVCKSESLGGEIVVRAIHPRTRHECLVSEMGGIWSERIPLPPKDYLTE